MSHFALSSQSPSRSGSLAFCASLPRLCAAVCGLSGPCSAVYDLPGPLCGLPGPCVVVYHLSGLCAAVCGLPGLLDQACAARCGIRGVLTLPPTSCALWAIPRPQGLCPCSHPASALLSSPEAPFPLTSGSSNRLGFSSFLASSFKKPTSVSPRGPCRSGSPVRGGSWAGLLAGHRAGHRAGLREWPRCGTRHGDGQWSDWELGGAVLMWAFPSLCLWNI